MFFFQKPQANNKNYFYFHTKKNKSKIFHKKTKQNIINRSIMSLKRKHDSLETEEKKNIVSLPLHQGPILTRLMHYLLNDCTHLDILWILARSAGSSKEQTQKALCGALHMQLVNRIGYMPYPDGFLC